MWQRAWQALLLLGLPLGLLAWPLREPLLLVHRAWGLSVRPWLVRRAQA